MRQIYIGDPVKYYVGHVPLIGYVVSIDSEKETATIISEREVPISEVLSLRHVEHLRKKP